MIECHTAENSRLSCDKDKWSLYKLHLIQHDF